MAFDGDVTMQIRDRAIIKGARVAAAINILERLLAEAVEEAAEAGFPDVSEAADVALTKARDLHEALDDLRGRLGSALDADPVLFSGGHDDKDRPTPPGGGG